MQPAQPPAGGFSFDLCQRNALLDNKGIKGPGFTKTGTTIAGVIYKLCGRRWAPARLGDAERRALPSPTQPDAAQDGVVLGADTRSTAGTTVADKNCEKIHYIAPNIYCCGAGTAADTENVTGMISSQLELHRYGTGRQSRVVTAMTLLKNHLFRYQGHVSAALVLGGVDFRGPHLFTIYPHGSTDALPYCTMGSGSLNAMAVFEAGYKDDMSREEAIDLVARAIKSGVYNDLGSGSNVDLCVITKEGVEYLRGHEVLQAKTYQRQFPQKFAAGSVHHSCFCSAQASQARKKRAPFDPSIRGGDGPSQFKPASTLFRTPEKKPIPYSLMRKAHSGAPGPRPAARTQGTEQRAQQRKRSAPSSAGDEAPAAAPAARPRRQPPRTEPEPAEGGGSAAAHLAAAREALLAGPEWERLWTAAEAAEAGDVPALGAFDAPLPQPDAALLLAFYSAHSYAHMAEKAFDNALTACQAMLPFRFEECMAAVERQWAGAAHGGGRGKRRRGAAPRPRVSASGGDDADGSPSDGMADVDRAHGEFNFMMQVTSLLGGPPLTGLQRAMLMGDPLLFAAAKADPTPPPGDDDAGPVIWAASAVPFGRWMEAAGAVEAARAALPPVQRIAAELRGHVDMLRERQGRRRAVMSYYEREAPAALAAWMDEARRRVARG
eukprot:scaffold7.g3612.t1